MSVLVSLLGGVKGVNDRTVNVKQNKLFPGVGNYLPRGCRLHFFSKGRGCSPSPGKCDQ